jgi:hypothetical protein
MYLPAAIKLIHTLGAERFLTRIFAAYYAVTTLEPPRRVLTEDHMNRSFSAFTALASIGFILVMSTQSSRSAQINTSPTLNAAKVSAAKAYGKAKITGTAARSRLHRLAIQVNVNDPRISLSTT